MITGKAPKVSKEPKFVGPDEVPMLPQYLVNQNPEEASGYHLQLKEWWESVHENLNRIRDMIVRFQVGELRQESTENLDSTKLLLLNYVNDLVDEANTSIQQTAANQSGHASRTDNPHSVTKAQVGLGNVTNADHATALSTHAGLTNNPHAVTAAQVSLGNVLNHASYAKTETYTKTEADTAISTAVANVQGQPGWTFVTHTNIFTKSSSSTLWDEEIQVFGLSNPTIPSNARYAMVAHETNQGYCEVYTGTNGNKFTRYGGGDDRDGGSIFIVENLQLPILFSRYAADPGGATTGDINTDPGRTNWLRAYNYYPNSTTHSNLTQEGYVRMRFGTYDTGSLHRLYLLGWSY